MSDHVRIAYLFFQKFQVLAKSMIFHGFSWNGALFATFRRKVRQNAETCQFVRKMWSFGQIDDFSWFFTTTGTFCNFLLKSSSKQKNMPVFSKSVKFWPNRWFFMASHEMRHLLQLFAEKFIKQKNMPVFQKVASFGQIDDFSWFFTKWGTFCNFLLKSWSKRKNMSVSSKSCEFWPYRWFFALYYEMRHFLQLFAENMIKTLKHASLFEKF